MGMKPNESILEKMQGNEAYMQALKEELPVGPDGVTPITLPEVANMTVKQLKAMGAVEVGSLDLSRSGQYAEGRTRFELSPEAEQRFRDSLKELTKDEEEIDPDFFVDDIGHEADRFTMTKDGRIVENQ